MLRSGRAGRETRLSACSWDSMQHTSRFHCRITYAPGWDTQRIARQKQLNNCDCLSIKHAVVRVLQLPWSCTHGLLLQVWPWGMSCREAPVRSQSNRALPSLVCKHAQPVMSMLTTHQTYLKSWKPSLVGSSENNYFSMFYLAVIEICACSTLRYCGAVQ